MNGIEGGHRHNIERELTGKIRFSLWAYPPLTIIFIKEKKCLYYITDPKNINYLFNNIKK
jgi:hypothetical protein